MKQIYVVQTGSYNLKPVMAYENRNDAVKACCALNDCDATGASTYIKALPFMYDQPNTVDITDIQTVIDMTLKAVESVNNFQTKSDA